MKSPLRGCGYIYLFTERSTDVCIGSMSRKKKKKISYKKGQLLSQKCVNKSTLSFAHRMCIGVLTCTILTRFYVFNKFISHKIITKTIVAYESVLIIMLVVPMIHDRCLDVPLV